MPLAPHAQPFHAEAVPDDSDAQRVGVLLLHGFTGSPASMVPWGRHLAEQGLGVSVPRLPGHGTSWREMNRTGWADWYGEAERSFEKLRAECDQVVVGGLSMGGALSLALAENRGSEVAGVVLVNPGLTNASPLRHLVPVLKHVLPSVPGVANDEVTGAHRPLERACHRGQHTVPGGVPQGVVDLLEGAQVQHHQSEGPLAQPVDGLGEADAIAQPGQRVAPCLTFAGQGPAP